MINDDKLTEEVLENYSMAVNSVTVPVGTGIEIDGLIAGWIPTSGGSIIINTSVNVSTDTRSGAVTGTFDQQTAILCRNINFDVVGAPVVIVLG